MKDPIKVFVASSNKKRALVEAFKDGLTASLNGREIESDIVPWFRPDVAPAGSDILTNLIHHCGGHENVRRSDFFVAFLTPDDALARHDKWTETPRDNCIFELGLFMGGLGLDSRRCFMVCSAKKEALPSDIQDRIYVPFDEPPASAKPQEIARALEAAIARVRDQIIERDKFLPLLFEGLSVRDLMERERPVSRKGKLDEDGEVLINRVHPWEERTPEGAARVNANLRCGIRYRYFFHDLNSHILIASLFHKLAISNPDENGLPRNEELNPEQARSNMRRNLAMMRNRLSIHLLQSHGPIEFCIHNVHHAPTCYLRNKKEEKFVPWCENGDASNVAKDLTRLFEDHRKVSPLHVFRTPKSSPDTTPFDASIDAIWAAIQDKFAELGDEDTKLLKNVCFGDRKVG